MAERAERVEGPERDWSADEDKAGEEGDCPGTKAGQLPEQRQGEQSSEEDHFRAEQRGDAGEQTSQEEGRRGGTLSRGGEYRKEGEACGGDRLHAGEDPVAGVGVGHDEEHHRRGKHPRDGRRQHRSGELAREDIGAGEAKDRAQQAECFAGDQPVGNDEVHRGEQEHPKRSGVSGNDVAVEGESESGGEAAGKLKMDVRVIFPVVPRMDEPVHAPQDGQGQQQGAREPGRRAFPWGESVF